jgi:hypothetical protein
LRVTFDTQTLDPITQPRWVACMTIHEALQSGRIEGFFCETVVTVEGGAAATARARSGGARSDFDLSAQGLEHLPLREQTAARVKRALDLGLRILQAPRIGSYRIDDPNGELYARDADEAAVATRLRRYESIATAIEARGLGFARVTRAPDTGRKAARAVAEWADGDSVAAHHGYANDLFCTEDRASRAGRKSVMHPAYRGWLRRAYGVEFVTIAELAALLGRLDG